jgi:3-oxoacyl-[acyl-carrier-protein] synthase II
MSKVVVTGLGIICCLGKGVNKVWPRLLGGDTCFQPISLPGFNDFVNRSGGEVASADFDPGPAYLSRHQQLGHLAAREACADSGLFASGFYQPHDIGMFAGVGAAGMLEAEEWLVRRDKKNLHTPARQLHSYPASSLADSLAAQYGVTGSRLSVATACSSSLSSLGLGFDHIRNKRVKAAVVVGGEGLSRLTYGGFHALRAIAPEQCQPFDRNRSGIFLGEGGGCLILEDYEHALARGAQIYCEVSGWGLSSDSYHMTAPHPDGRGAQEAMTQALRQSSLQPRDIGYINMHGTGTSHNDLAETNGVKAVFGDHAADLLLSSTKSMTGHCLGAAGAIESVFSVLALHHGHCPPTACLKTPDPACDLNYLPCLSRKQSGMNHVMNNVLAFGGNNVSVVFSKGSVTHGE